MHYTYADTGDFNYCRAKGTTLYISLKIGRKTKQNNMKNKRKTSKHSFSLKVNMKIQFAKSNQIKIKNALIEHKIDIRYFPTQGMKMVIPEFG